MTASSLEIKLKKLGTKERAKINAYFFKTGKGQYGAGDMFLGVTVPITREVIKHFLNLPLREIQKGLRNPYHEVRLASVLILVHQYKLAKMETQKKKIFDFYMKNAARVNNWDLVDSSSEYIVGHYISQYMSHKKRLSFLDKGIASKNLWINRIIVLATFYQIKEGNEKMIFYVAPKFFTHQHDLMHKAVGWMLREVGKKVGKKYLVEFLNRYASEMPRTALRYAIEHFSKKEREKYMKVKIS